MKFDPVVVIFEKMTKKCLDQVHSSQVQNQMDRPLMDSLWISALITCPLLMFQLLLFHVSMIFQLLSLGLLVMLELLSLGPWSVMSRINTKILVVALLCLAAMAFAQETCEKDVQILISANNAHQSEGKKFHLKVKATIFLFFLTKSSHS